MLPNFFVLGTQKGGTTTLQNLLIEHPDIYLPLQKETKFFARDREWERGVEFYERKYFADVTSEKAIGEIDPDYMYCDLALERMLSVFADISSLKFIFILRNPIDRAFSHYLMTLRRGHESLSFDQAIEAEMNRLQSTDFDEKMHFSYVSRGQYYQQVSRFLEHVPKENVLILFSDDLNRFPGQVVQKVFQFLGVDEQFTPKKLNQHFHKAQKPRLAGMRAFLDHAGWLKRAFRKIFPFVALRQRLKRRMLQWNETGKYSVQPKVETSTRLQLAKVFNDDIQKLARLCGRDLSHWK